MTEDLLHLRISRLAGGAAADPTHAIVRLPGVTTSRVAFDPETRILRIPGGLDQPLAERTMRQLLDALLGSDAAAPRLSNGDQMALGAALGDLVWGGQERPPIGELLIETDDPTVAGLPWPLARSGSTPMLVAEGTPVRLQVGPPGGPLPAASLRRGARILLCLPSPQGLPPTGAEIHVQELEATLGAAANILPDRPVTFAQLVEALNRQKPDILYYFGHADRFLRELMLAMEDGSAGRGRQDWKAADLAAAIRGHNAALPASGRLTVVYLNACWGGILDTSEQGLQLAAQVPVFISNRTSALAKVARQHALRTLHAMVNYGMPPQAAVTHVMREARENRPPFRGLVSGVTEPWWMTPIVFGAFGQWDGLVDRRDGVTFTEGQTLSLDRGQQVMRAEQSLRFREPVVALIWQGGEAEGPEALVRRLGRDLRDATGSRLLPLLPLAVPWPRLLEGVRVSDDPVERKSLGRERQRILAEALAGCFAEDGAPAGAAAPEAPAADPRVIAALTAKALGRRPGTARLAMAPWPSGVAPRVTAAAVNALLGVLSEHVAPHFAERPGTPQPWVVVLVPVTCPTGHAGEELAQALDRVVQLSRPGVAARLLPRLGPVEVDDILGLLQSEPPARQIQLGDPRLAAAWIHGETGGSFTQTRASLESFTGIPIPGHDGDLD